MRLMGGAGGPTSPPTGSDMSEDQRPVRAPDVATLERAVEEHPALEWDPRMGDLAGADGLVNKDDTDGTSQVHFPSVGMMAWLPTSALIPTGPEADSLPGAPGIRPGRAQHLHQDPHDGHTGVSSLGSLGAGSATDSRRLPPGGSLPRYDQRLRQGSPATRSVPFGQRVLEGPKVGRGTSPAESVRPDRFGATRSYEGPAGRPSAGPKAVPPTRPQGFHGFGQSSAAAKPTRGLASRSASA